ncbi:hypothetical protein ACRE_004530 [Hapsidospora chrysogenum ATCC 11550]|uniref:Uncharacterized protein n=1 Tax=Hapsidospora chrysogenum (strain ATCC 11550 / CBS 779.69 / DSM 880 / IAM 14645 / JCM 23072 / IMI 49137) TaxID=857340 RepID=A0A086TH53_HAPC1|nr:hypothetical protein ACRE_004530 [Hapsidospora chrysogenum ATCC 11550]
MADTAVSNDADAASQRAAEQARLRKERREAKLRAGGSARLNKITGLSGRPQADFDPPAPAVSSDAPAAPASTAAAAATAPKTQAPHADPEEVDISEHFYAPKATARAPNAPPAGAEPNLSDAALRQMMLGMDPPAAAGNPQAQQDPFAGMPGAGDDPIMKMMSQMMGAGGPGGSSFPGMGSMPGMPGMQQQQKPLDPYTALWRLLHAIVALGLGLYIVVLTPFTGTKLERERAAVSEIEDNEERKRLFFWVFATAEACLLTTRFFLDKGRAPPTGIVWTVTGYLPEPLKGYVQVVVRYGQIFSTVRADILGCMFVLGVCSWWRA